MQVLLILNTETGAGPRSETAVRLAGALVRNDDTHVRLFIVSGEQDAGGARPSVDDTARVARHLADLVAAGVEVRSAHAGPDGSIPGSAIDGVLGVEPSTIRGMSEWTLEADRILVF